MKNKAFGLEYATLSHKTISTWGILGVENKTFNTHFSVFISLQQHEVKYLYSNHKVLNNDYYCLLGTCSETKKWWENSKQISSVKAISQTRDENFIMVRMMIQSVTRYLSE